MTRALLRLRWAFVLAALILIAAAGPASAMSCGELRLMAASGVIGPMQRYTITARCGEKKSTSTSKLTWTGFESSSTNTFSVWMTVLGKASWDRATGEATESLRISGDVSGERIATGICNADPFLKDAPGGPAKCHGITAQYRATSGETYEWFIEPRFFVSRLISFVEAQALSAKSGTPNAPPPPPTPAPAPAPAVKTMKSPGGALVWEGERLFTDHQFKLRGGRLGTQPMSSFGSDWSGDAQLLWMDAQNGSSLDLQIEIETAGVYVVSLGLTKGPDFGIVQTAVDGARSRDGFDGYSPQVTRDGRVELGSFTLQPGPHTISLTVVGKNRQSSGFLVGVDRVAVTPSRGRTPQE